MKIYKESSKNGMTLIEILIVITLIGLLTGVLVKSLGGNLDAGKKATAKLFCSKTIRSAIEAYKVTHDSRLPANWKDLEKLITLDNDSETAPKDPWNNDYVLIPNPGIGGGTPKVMEGIQSEEPQAVAGYVLVRAQAPDGEFVFAYNK
ncbi:MAG: type II secretion system GspH family protein [Puniceicoccales bacterium]|jgi:general secretion pathway protein G|nr:type II secretion system GspH family protein [Puniceicoccales bacterium]